MNQENLKKIELYTNKFHEDGYVVVEDVVNVDLVDKLLSLCNENYDEVMNLITDNNYEFNVGTKHGFLEIVERHSKRFEMPYKMNSGIVGELINEQVRLNPVIDRLTKSILGEDATVINQSLIMCLPGADAQSWHSDGAHVNIEKHMKCHCLNVFVPLLDVTKELGPTEIRPGSHYYSRDLTKLFFLAAMKKTLRTPVVPEIRRGSILLFDYRVLHRGTANKTPSTRRPIVAITYAKSWFRDLVNFPKRSVYEMKIESKENTSGERDKN